jgi:hypothetical protein
MINERGKDMIKYYVYNEKSEVSSEAFLTREEAEKELREETQHLYGDDANIVEVDD